MNDRPDPTVEEPERFPGGVDSIADEAKYGDIPDEPLIRDLEPGKNPAVDDNAPDEITEPDAKTQEPEGEADDHESGTERTPEAGQESEDGSPEPPA